jgi:protein AroM
LTGTTSPRPVGVVTIGQTPRDDLTPELARPLPGVQLVERGALDGLTADEIASLAPGPDEVPVITRLAGGGSVTVSHGRITSLLRRALEDLVADGVLSTILACTGEFPEIDVPGVLRPGTLMRRALAGYAECGYRVGVVCPLAEQIEVVERSWNDAGIPVQVAAADPYAWRPQPRASWTTAQRWSSSTASATPNATGTSPARPPARRSSWPAA